MFPFLGNFQNWTLSNTAYNSAFNYIYKLNISELSMYVNQTLKFQNMHDENENYMNLLQPAKYPLILKYPPVSKYSPILKFPPILIIEFQGLSPRHAHCTRITTWRLRIKI